MLISCILIALDNKPFRKAYKEYDESKDLAKFLVDTVVNELRKSNIASDKLNDLKIQFSFIETETSLVTKTDVLKDLIEEIDENINRFIKTHEFYDVLGQLYIEFLRYANSDKGLGIVLTPPHITELFSDLAQVNKNDVVYDNCAGTGGFLISAMKKMIANAEGDSKKIKEIKSKQLVGVEYQSHIFALAISNMYIHQDGKTNVIKGNCFDEKIQDKVREFHPNVGFLNPPYKSDKKKDIEELEYVLNNLETLEKGGICVAIVPMNSVVSTTGKVYELKKRILEKHTLEAVLSMPDDLFHNSNINVVTAIIVIIAHKPHPKNKETFFGYFKDDGFIKIKNKGRIDYYGRWEKIKEKWLHHFFNKKESPGFSINKIVTAENEWCAEAYMETDYTQLSAELFINNIKKYLAYKLTKDNSNIYISPEPLQKGKEYKLDTSTWKYFFYDIYDKSIFKIKKGKRLTKKDQIPGKIPYVSSSSLNNGIDNYIGNGYTDENCLTFACYGSIGEVFYQEGKVWASDNVNVFYLRNKELNPYIAMFLITVLRLEKFRFSYGMTAKKERLQKFKIKLPEKKGEPDFEFMEKFIKSLPYSSSL